MYVPSCSWLGILSSALFFSNLYLLRGGVVVLCARETIAIYILLAYIFQTCILLLSLSVWKRRTFYAGSIIGFAFCPLKRQRCMYAAPSLLCGGHRLCTVWTVDSATRFLVHARYLLLTRSLFRGAFPCSTGTAACRSGSLCGERFCSTLSVPTRSCISTFLFAPAKHC